MLDPLTTTIWSPTVQYTFPIRNATVSGSTVTVTYINHQLSSGDVVAVTGSGAQSSFSGSGAVTVIDGNRFSYVATIPPTAPSLAPTPGQKTNLWLTCPSYSTLLVYPNKLRTQVASGTEIVIQTFEDNLWVTQQTVVWADGLTDIVFNGKYNIARLKMTAGTFIPTVTSYNANAPDPTPAAATTYFVPKFTNAALEPVVTPGTYDTVTVNEFGQVISGTVGGTVDKNIYATMMNSGSSNILKGQPVRKLSDTTIELAQGNTSRKGVIGLAAEPILIGEVKQVMIEGSLAMTSAEWDAVTGDTGGLVADGSPYFLDFSVAGKLEKDVNVDTAPASSYLVTVGYAISSTAFRLDIDAPIKVS